MNRFIGILQFLTRISITQDLPYDEEFEKYFKILVDFNDDMERTKENEEKIISFISSYTKSENLLPFNKTAVAQLMEYSSRLIGNQTKFSSRFNKIIEIIIEANQWAKLEEASLVSDIHVKQAVYYPSFAALIFPQTKSMPFSHIP